MTKCKAVNDDTPYEEPMLESSRSAVINPLECGMRDVSIAASFYKFIQV